MGHSRHSHDTTLVSCIECSFFYEIYLNRRPENKNQIYKDIIEQHRIEKQTNLGYRQTHHNFKIKGNEEYFTQLYDEFEYTCLRLFKNIKISPKNNRSCWAYVSNSQDHSGYDVIHNHCETSTINGVFYFNVPCQNSGSLSFFNKQKEEIFEYYPKENFIVIFPNHQYHSANISKSSEYRISINVELTCC
jgi:hypothetical protein